MSSAPLKDKALCLIRQQIQIFSLIACPLPYSRLGTGTASNATAAELKAFFGFFQLFHFFSFFTRRTRDSKYTAGEKDYNAVLITVKTIRVKNVTH